MHVTRWFALSALVACAVAAPKPAMAEPQLRLGVTDDPDTLFIGFGFENLVSRMRSGYIAITPKLDLGFGEDADFFTVRGSADFEFLFAVGSRGTYLYPLVGVSLYYLNFDNCAGDCDDTSVGVNVGFGIKFDRFYLEAVAGIEDRIPDITLAFGIGL